MKQRVKCAIAAMGPRYAGHAVAKERYFRADTTKRQSGATAARLNLPLPHGAALASPGVPKDNSALRRSGIRTLFAIEIL